MTTRDFTRLELAMVRLESAKRIKCPCCRERAVDAARQVLRTASDLRQVRTESAAPNPAPGEQTEQEEEANSSESDEVRADATTKRRLA